MKKKNFKGKMKINLHQRILVLRTRSIKVILQKKEKRKKKEREANIISIPSGQLSRRTNGTTAPDPSLCPPYINS